MPSLTINPSAKKTMTPKPNEAHVDIPSAVAKLKAAMNELEGIFVSRTEEINMITLALTIGQHVLLEGKHGIAKSDIAREAFARITKAQVYDKMFSKGVTPDDVFGPTKMEEYRKGNWEHNTAGRLPTAHFANLEELGRASDLLLPSTMSILNERIFHNGHLVQKCPLITAIATTNFLDEGAELAAFNDRWLIRAIVQPLNSNQKVIEMLNRALEDRRPVKDTVSLNEILAINAAAKALPVDKEVLPLYADLVSSYKKEDKIEYISDRRIVASFRLARAQALLDGASSVSSEHLGAVRYGISVVGKYDETKFMGVLQRIVGNATAIRKENLEIAKIEKFIRKLRDDYDPSSDKKSLNEIMTLAGQAYDGLRSRTTPFLVPENQQKFASFVSDAESLRKEIKQQLASRS